MSTASAARTAGEINDKQQEILSYLEREAASGKEFFKSKFMSEELDMSAKEIGSNMVQLTETTGRLSIEKWSYASATTWRVERA